MACDESELTAEQLLCLQTREICPKCEKSRGFYCHVCNLPMSSISRKLPRVKLPFHVDILRHSNEVNGKNTGSHAAILAPDYVTVYEYPSIPDYSALDSGEKKESTLVLFPCDSSMHMSELREIPTPTRLLILDSTWRDVKYMMADLRISGLKRVALPEQRTQFWRADFKKRPKNYLATIEALYYFLVEYCEKVERESYEGQYDGLMLFFDYFLKRVEKTDFVYAKSNSSASSSFS